MAEKEEVQSVGECTLNKMQAVVYLVCDLLGACLLAYKNLTSALTHVPHLSSSQEPQDRVAGKCHCKSSSALLG